MDLNRVVSAMKQSEYKEAIKIKASTSTPASGTGLSRGHILLVP